MRTFCIAHTLLAYLSIHFEVDVLITDFIGALDLDFFNSTLY